MQVWVRRLVWWGLPTFFVVLYTALLLTNGQLTDFFQPKSWGSLLYANMWDHFLHGNAFIDPQYATGEYFIVGNHMVTYFGAMPALIRALGTIFFDNAYLFNMTNLSMVLAVALALGSVWYAVRRVAAGRPWLILLGTSIVAAILFASPVSYLLVWSWTYHEVIVWAVAWALLFVSLYTLWLFDKQSVGRGHFALMGLAVGMAVLCRPTMGLTLAVPYASLCVLALRQRAVWRLAWPGMALCAVLALITLGINYQRWGNPLTFVQLDRNVQLVELYPERAAAIRQSGEFNTSRLASSFYYYFVPSGANFQKSFPFVTPDRQLDGFESAPQYDYIEGSRVPLPLSMTYLIVLAGLGVLSIRYFGKTQKMTIGWLLAGSLLTCGALLAVYAVALRYTAELVPPAVFLGLVYIVALRRGLVAAPKRWMVGGLIGVAIVSLCMTVVTTIAYKEFVWNVPPPVREEIRQFINYRPTTHETKHIINGVRFPVY